MSLFLRFFGNSNDDEDFRNANLAANPRIEHPLSLQVLFPGPSPLESERLADAFRSYHPSMSGVVCGIDPMLNREGKIFGLVGWGNHVVRCLGFDFPMPAEAVETCVDPSHYPQELKQRARAHKAHIILYYAGYESSPVEQYVALAATAGVLARFGAIVVLNESGHTSFPAFALSGLATDGDVMDLLRTLPLPILYCGFVKHEVEGIPGVWMRTYGAPLLGLPDLAVHASAHREGQRFFEIFNHVFEYLRESGAHLAAGHTLQIGQDECLRARQRTDGESFFSSAGDLLVVEIIGADEINR